MEIGCEGIDFSAPDFASKVFWLVGDEGLSYVRDHIAPLREDAVIVALGYQTFLWAKTSELTVFVPPDFFSVSDLTVLSENAAIAALDIVLRASINPRWTTHEGHRIDLPGIDLELAEWWTFRATQIALIVRSLEQHLIAWNMAPAVTGWDPQQHSHSGLTELIHKYLQVLIDTRHIAGPSTQLLETKEQSKRWSINLLSIKVALVMLRDRLLPRNYSPRLHGVSEHDAIIVAVESDLSRKRNDFAEILASGLDVVFVPFSSKRAGNTKRAGQVGQRLGLPTLAAPIGNPIAAKVHSWLIRARLWSRTSSTLHTPFSADHAVTTVAGELANRWGVLTSEYSAWKRYWQTKSPRCVVVVRSTASSVLPALAAADIGIPLCTVPHGVIAREWPIFPEKSTSNTEIVHLTAFTLNQSEAKRGFVATPEGLILHEYPRTRGAKGSVAWAGYKKVFLVLVDHDNVLLNGLQDAEAQANFICSVARRHPNCLFVIKDHPSGPIVRLAFPKYVAPNLVFAGRDEDLHHAIDMSDGIVLLNYWGSAAVHAFLSEKPLVRLRVGRSLSGHYPIHTPAGMVGIIKEIHSATSMEELRDFVESVERCQGTQKWVSRPRGSLARTGPRLVELIRCTRESEEWTTWLMARY